MTMGDKMKRDADRPVMRCENLDLLARFDSDGRNSKS